MIASVVILLAAECWICAAFRTSIGGIRFKSVSGGVVRPSIPSTLQMSPSPPEADSNDAANASSDGGGEVEQLKQTASKLRAEAQAAEDALRSSRGTVATSPPVKEVTYSNLNDSCWELTYRFANEPESKDNDDEKNENNLPRKYYSGKLQLKFRDDGYTDILSSGDGNTETTATFQKVWGWDPETSAEDSLDYILFSADVSLPPPISTSERFYFQARIDKEGKNEDVLSLQDGSVTVKRDVETPGGVGWGIFRGAGSILAQFRQVGGFRCRPIASSKLE